MSGPGVCFEFQNKGRCERKNCFFKHIAITRSRGNRQNRRDMGHINYPSKDHYSAIPPNLRSFSVCGESSHPKNLRACSVSGASRCSYTSEQQWDQRRKDNQSFSNYKGQPRENYSQQTDGINRKLVLLADNYRSEVHQHKYFENRRVVIKEEKDYRSAVGIKEEKDYRSAVGIKEEKDYRSAVGIKPIKFNPSVPPPDMKPPPVSATLALEQPDIKPPPPPVIAFHNLALAQAELKRLDEVLERRALWMDDPNKTKAENIQDLQEKMNARQKIVDLIERMERWKPSLGTLEPRLLLAKLKDETSFVIRKKKTLSTETLIEHFGKFGTITNASQRNVTLPDKAYNEVIIEYYYHSMVEKALMSDHKDISNTYMEIYFVDPSPKNEESMLNVVFPNDRENSTPWSKKNKKYELNTNSRSGQKDRRTTPQRNNTNIDKANARGDRRTRSIEESETKCRGRQSRSRSRQSCERSRDHYSQSRGGKENYRRCSDYESRSRSRQKNCERGRDHQRRSRSRKESGESRRHKNKLNHGDPWICNNCRKRNAPDRPGCFFCDDIKAGNWQYEHRFVEGGHEQAENSNSQWNRGDNRHSVDRRTNQGSKWDQGNGKKDDNRAEVDKEDWRRYFEEQKEKNRKENEIENEKSAKINNRLAMLAGNYLMVDGEALTGDDDEEDEVTWLSPIGPASNRNEEDQVAGSSGMGFRAGMGLGRRGLRNDMPPRNEKKNVKSYSDGMGNGRPLRSGKKSNIEICVVLSDSDDDCVGKENENVVEEVERNVDSDNESIEISNKMQESLDAMRESAEALRVAPKEKRKRLLKEMGIVERTSEASSRESPECINIDEDDEDDLCVPGPINLENPVSGTKRQGIPVSGPSGQETPVVQPRRQETPVSETSRQQNPVVQPRRRETPVPGTSRQENSVVQPTSRETPMSGTSSQENLVVTPSRQKNLRPGGSQKDRANHACLPDTSLYQKGEKSKQAVTVPAQSLQPEERKKKKLKLSEYQSRKRIPVGEVCIDSVDRRGNGESSEANRRGCAPDGTSEGPSRQENPDGKLSVAISHSHPDTQTDDDDEDIVLILPGENSRYKKN